MRPTRDFVPRTGAAASPPPKCTRCGDSCASRSPSSPSGKDPPRAVSAPPPPPAGGSARGGGLGAQPPPPIRWLPRQGVDAVPAAHRAPFGLLHAQRQQLLARPVAQLVLHLGRRAGLGGGRLARLVKVFG